MKCIDFDQAFEAYLSDYLKKNAKQYKNYDAMEAAMPEIYQTFLEEPAEFLAGAKPGEYFLPYTDAKTLVNWMEDYVRQHVTLPDMLLNRISEMGEAAEDALMHILDKPRAPEEAKMTAVGLLREMGSTKPLHLYVEWQKNRTASDELADNALDSLKNMGDAALGTMQAALATATPDGQAALLDVLVNFPATEEVLQTAMHFFTSGDQRALFAGYLQKLGDERALPALIRAAEDTALTYFDYIEIRAAIEALGGEAPERSFGEEDPAYAALEAAGAKLKAVSDKKE